MVNEQTIKYFNCTYEDVVKSEAYSKYCVAVYGKDLKQFNRTSMAQLSKMINVMSFEKDQKILDLGCGTGHILEYLIDKYNMTGIGVDISDKAISLAKERCITKKDSLDFFVGDINELNFQKDTFDKILIIDSFGKATKLKKVFNDIKSFLKVNGMLGIFYSETTLPEEPKHILEPDNTEVAVFLKKTGLKYQYIDFTQDEIDLWTKSKQVLDDLKNNFIEDGMTELYNDLAEDTEDFLDIINSSRLTRYFYWAKNKGL